MHDDFIDWQILELEDFRLRLKDLYPKHSEEYWPNPPEFVIEAMPVVRLRIEKGECYIRGELKNGEILVEELKLEGEGSDKFYSFIFNSALNFSHGRLKATWRTNRYPSCCIHTLDILNGEPEWLRNL